MKIKTHRLSFIIRQYQEFLAEAQANGVKKLPIETFCEAFSRIAEVVECLERSALQASRTYRDPYTGAVIQPSQQLGAQLFAEAQGIRTRREYLKDLQFTGVSAGWTPEQESTHVYVIPEKVQGGTLTPDGTFQKDPEPPAIWKRR